VRNLNHFIESGALVYFCIFAVLAVFLVPPGEAPDEPAHVAYINFVARNLELPNQYSHDSKVPEGHQPPLYYVVCAAITRLINSDNAFEMRLTHNPRQSFRDGRFLHDVPVYLHSLSALFPQAGPIFTRKEDRVNFYSLRMLSVAMGVLNIWLILRLSALLLGDSKWRFFPALFVASLPQYIFMSAVINNDALANLISTFTIYLSFRVWFYPDRAKGFILLGIAVGLGLLTKKTVIMLLPALLVVLTWTVWKQRSRVDKEKVALLCLYAVIIATVISGWFFVRNELVYGDLLAAEMEKRFIMTREISLFTGDVLTSFVPKVFVSFVAEFGWNHVRLPQALYFIYLAILAIGAIGYLTRLYMCGRTEMAPVLLLIFCFSAIAGFLYSNVTFYHGSGRLLFPILSVLAIQLGIGLRPLM
jgi:4-amino-4-deoxy-L-arabinose transferase-like glycosyltransferase